MTYNGNWTNGITEDFDASLQIAVYSEGFTLKLGTDDDRSLCDVYVDNVFWGSLDTYTATPGELAVTIPLARLGLHVVEIRNRPERNTAAVPVSATSFKLEFKQLETAYDGHAIDYTYDDLSRLLAADYFAAWDAVNPVREYDFSYDVAGNRLSEVVNVDGSPFSGQTHTYDDANRISNAGFAYNDAGQMTADGTLSYSWNRAGRLLGAGDSSYAYNGLGQRVQQTVSGVVTDYLLDVQPGLAKVIAAMTGANTERFVHERGLLSQQDSNGDWQWMVADGLGSVRGVVDGTGFDPAYSVHYAPYGQPWGEQGTEQTPFGFTSEPTDDNGLVHLRARYYNPALGVFPSLDPVEGVLQQAMSLNRYAYVAGNVVNRIDPTGLFDWGTCSPDESVCTGTVQAGDCIACIGREGGLGSTIIIYEGGRCTNDWDKLWVLQEFIETVVSMNCVGSGNQNENCALMEDSSPWRILAGRRLKYPEFFDQFVEANPDTEIASVQINGVNQLAGTHCPCHSNQCPVPQDDSCSPECAGSSSATPLPVPTRPEPPRDCQREAEQAFERLYDPSFGTQLFDLAFGNETAGWVLNRALMLNDICVHFTEEEIAVLVAIKQEEASLGGFADFGTGLTAIISTALSLISMVSPETIEAPDCFVADTLNHVYEYIGSPRHPRRVGCPT